MAFTPTNFLTADRALDQIGQDATTYFNNGDRAIEQIVQAANNLAAMQTAWGPAIAFIDAQAAANPSDEQWAALKARKDKMVANFFQMRDLIIAVRDAAQAARA